jgi:hypothetical protein
MGKNKCSICGAEIDSLDDLIIHEAEHESGCEPSDLKGPTVAECKQVVDALEGFDAEYIGGHIKFPGQTHVKLRLDKTKLNVTQVQHSFEPFLSIPYTRITAVQLAPAGQTSAFFVAGDDIGKVALTAGASILFNQLFSKPKLFLVIAFIDEYDLQQSVAFQMQGVEEAQQIIYDKVAQVKRRKRKALE